MLPCGVEPHSAGTTVKSTTYYIVLSRQRPGCPFHLARLTVINVPVRPYLVPAGEGLRRQQSARVVQARRDGSHMIALAYVHVHVQLYGASKHKITEADIQREPYMGCCAGHVVKNVPDTGALYLRSRKSGPRTAPQIIGSSTWHASRARGFGDTVILLVIRGLDLSESLVKFITA